MKKGLFVFVLFVSQLAFAQNSIVQQITQQINQDSLVTYVKQLSGLLPVDNQIIKTRYAGTSGNTLTEQFIKQKLTSWGVSYNEVVFSPSGTNIIAKIEGRRTDKILMMGAHFDAVGTSNPDITVYYPGADDNASGTAAVLEAVRVCAQHQFPITLHFAFWDEEEQSLVGSRASAPDYMNKLVGYINHDMIAWSMNNDSVVEVHTGNLSTSIEMAQRVVNIIALYNIPLKAQIMNPGNPNSDHGAFWQNNLTAVGINEIYDGPLMNPHWHRPTDSLSKLNIPYFYQVGKLGLTTLLHLAMDSLNLVGLNYQSLSKDFAVYPNPVADLLYIDNNNNEPLNITVFDMFGNLVLTTSTQDSQPLSIKNLATGVYVIQISTQQNQVSRKRFIKK